MEKHVFIVGSKGIPANYGGYETFVEYLTDKQVDKSIKYHVACKVTDKNSMRPEHFEHNGADCFKVYVPNIGPAQAIYYDLKALKYSLEYAKKYKIKNPIFYILAARIGPFMSTVVKQIHSIGGEVFLNPDGHEWMRAKWSKPVRAYWKYSEKHMVKHADLIICDSKNIEKYIQDTYPQYQPKTTFIAYGAEIQKSKLKDDDSKLLEWFNKFKIRANDYYLVVGRFVPENNYETMISEFMASSTNKDLVIITNIEHNKFYDYLKDKTEFDQDKRIKFVGTVYDTELLKKIRELAYAYIHGHSVGGTNPSLLEALASTKLNLLYDVGFNREVAEDSALYWSRSNRSLAKLVEDVDIYSTEKINKLDLLSTERIKEAYSWSLIVDEYEREFRR